MIISGSISKDRPDGTQVTADYLADTEAGTIVQVGGDAEITAEDIDLIQALATTPHEGDPEQ